MKQFHYPKICPSCKNTTFSVYDSDVICNKCGLAVIEEAIFASEDYTGQTKEQRYATERTGTPIKQGLIDLGLSSKISHFNRDIRNKPLPPEESYKWQRLRKQEGWTKVQQGANKNLITAFPELYRLCGELNTPKHTRERCAIIYKKAINQRLSYGRSIETLVAAVVYAVSRDEGIPITLNEITEVSTMKRRDIGRATRIISKTFGLKQVSDPELLVNKYASMLAQSDEKAIELIKSAKEKGLLGGTTPANIAIAALCYANDLSFDDIREKMPLIRRQTIDRVIRDVFEKN